MRTAAEEETTISGLRNTEYGAESSTEKLSFYGSALNVGLFTRWVVEYGIKKELFPTQNRYKYYPVT